METGSNPNNQRFVAKPSADVRPAALCSILPALIVGLAGLQGKSSIDARTGQGILPYPSGQDKRNLTRRIVE